MSLGTELSARPSSARGVEPPSAGTVRALLIAALIFQALFALVLVFILLEAASLVSQFSPEAGLAATTVGVVVFFLSILFLAIAYAFTYARVRDEDYEGAHIPCLILGILCIVTGSIITGVLYLVAFFKLGDLSDDGTYLEPEAARWSPPRSPGTRRRIILGTSVTGDRPQGYNGTRSGVRS